MPAGLVLALLIGTVATVAIVIVAPGVTVSRGGKALAFLALFVFPIAVSFLGAKGRDVAVEPSPGLHGLFGIGRIAAFRGHRHLFVRADFLSQSLTRGLIES